MEGIKFIGQMLQNYINTMQPGVAETMAGAIQQHMIAIEADVKLADETRAKAAEKKGK